MTMAVLRTKNQEVYTKNENINRLITPCEIKSVYLSKTLIEKGSQPLDEKTSVTIYEFIPDKIKDFCKDKRLSPSGSVTLWKEAESSLKKEIENNFRPHINNNNESYFLISGALIFYLNVPYGMVSLLLQPGDCLYYDGSIEHWIKVTNDYFFTLACYHDETGAKTNNKIFTSEYIGDNSIL